MARVEVLIEVRYTPNQAPELEPALTLITAVAAAVLKLAKKPTQWILGRDDEGRGRARSTVPGPNFPLYVAASRSSNFHVFGLLPRRPQHHAVGYDGAVNLGVPTDEAVVTDRELFLRCFDQAIAEMLELAERAAALTV